MKTLAGVAHGLSRNLIERAADVMLKEQRPLVIVPRETPMSLPQLRNMVLCAEAGAMILPAMPAFYQLPKTLDDLADFMAGKILSRARLRARAVSRRGPARSGPDHCHSNRAVRTTVFVLLRAFVMYTVSIHYQCLKGCDRRLEIAGAHRGHVRRDRRALRFPQPPAERRHRSPLAAAARSGRSR